MSLFNMSGNLSVEILPKLKEDFTLQNIFRGLFPNAYVSSEVSAWRRRNFRYALPGFLRYLRSRIGAGPRFVGALNLALIDKNGKVTDFGLVSLDIITTVGANFVVSALMGSASMATLRFHGLGSSSAGLAVGNTALAAELASSYSSANIRATGTAALGTANNIFVSVGSTTFTGTVSCSEWGLFSQASTLTGTPAGGTLFDRSTFATQGVLATFAAKTTYTLTVASGT